MSALVFSLLVASRWAVAVVPVDPGDGELAQNLAGVLEAQVTEMSGAPVAAGEELRARLGLAGGRGILGCVGDAQCLQRAGVPASYQCHSGMIHLFYALGRLIPYAQVALARIGVDIQTALS